MTAFDGCFSTAGLGAEWYKWACTIAIRHFTVYEKWKKRQQNRARMRSSSTKLNTGFLALDAENGTMKNARPYQNKFGEKISGTVATAK